MRLPQVCLIPLFLACTAAQAGGASFGVELESEKDNRSGLTNHAVTLIPGWQFGEDEFISSVELLVEKNRDTTADTEGFRAQEIKRFLRLRHDGEISDAIDYYVRGGFGRSTNNVRSFNYAYVEPGIELKAGERWEWVASLREVRATDGTPGQRVHKLYLGPSVMLSKNDELEFRYVTARGDQNTRTLLTEFVHRF